VVATVPTLPMRHTLHEGLRDAYARTYEDAMRDPEWFWGHAAQQLHWDVPPPVVLDRSNPPLYRWFTGGMLNTCYNAIDRHVESGRGEQAAVIYDSPVTGVQRTLSYRELLSEVANFAGVLASLGVRQGDRVVIYMPMTAEALIAMYGCARIGAVHSVVFGGFAANELAVRIEDAAPSVIVSASCGIEMSRVVDYKVLLDRALELSAHKPAHVITLQRPQRPCGLVPGRDHDWHELMARAEPVGCVSVRATDPLYILYTSGTTGRPKGVVRDHGGHAVALLWSMRHVYDMDPGEVFWAASDVGWVVGHSYIVYGPLLLGCTTIIHEGKPVGTPDAGEFWRVIQEHGVSVLFTAPTAIRAIKKEDPKGIFYHKFDTSSLRALFLAGERLDPDTYHWARALIGRPVIDHWWQTETGWPVAANCLGIEQLPVKPGSPTKPVPGYVVEIVDDEGNVLPPEREGSVTIRLPLPPGTLLSLWGDDERFVSTYLSKYPGHYLTGDGGYIDEDGYLFIMGRIDDVIIVAGHNLSTGSMEQALAAHPDVAECAVFGVKDPLKTQLPVGLVVLKAGVDRRHEDICEELVNDVRAAVGPVANFRKVAVVARLPKTRSGKVLRGTMRKIADAEPFTIPPTIDDPATLDVVAEALRSLGYARGADTRIGG